jgi:hypothetical protein
MVARREASRSTRKNLFCRAKSFERAKLSRDDETPSASRTTSLVNRARFTRADAVVFGTAEPHSTPPPKPSLPSVARPSSAEARTATATAAAPPQHRNRTVAASHRSIRTGLLMLGPPTRYGRTHPSGIQPRSAGRGRHRRDSLLRRQSLARATPTGERPHSHAPRRRDRPVIAETFGSDDLDPFGPPAAIDRDVLATEILAS